MRKTYVDITDKEYEVLSRAARITGADCWFFLNVDEKGTYFSDLEEATISFYRAVQDMDCCVDIDRDEVFNDDIKTIKDLLERLKANRYKRKAK